MSFCKCDSVCDCLYRESSEESENENENDETYVNGVNDFCSRRTIDKSYKKSTTKKKSTSSNDSKSVSTKKLAVKLSSTTSAKKVATKVQPSRKEFMESAKLLMK